MCQIAMDRVLTHPARSPLEADCPFREIIARAKMGDAEMFAKIVNQLAARLLAVCSSRCSGPVECEVVANAVWFSVWKRLPSFEGECLTDVLNLALSMVRHRAIDEFRRTKNFPELFPVDANGKTFDVVHREAPKIESVDERIDALQRCLKRHEDLDCVHTWKLHHADGLSHAEIAIRLNIEIGTVGSRITRARKMIAGCIRGIVT
jgi:RNA polymerase sigma factor (sigma-70 family)